MVKVLASIFAMSLSTHALCCSFAPDEIFSPNTNLEFRDDNDIPALKVEIMNISRGRNARTGDISCVDIGGVTLRVSMPSGSKFSINEFGFYFQILDGAFPNGGTPNSQPVKLSNPIKNTGEYRLRWVEGDPKPFKAKLLVSAINKRLHVGAPVIIKIAHDAKTRNKSVNSQP